MKKMLLLIVAIAVCGVLGAAESAEPVKMALEHFRTYKNKDAAGIVEYVAKSAEIPMTRRKFIPDASAQKYLIQLYGHDPAALTDTKTYTLTVTVSDDVNPEAELSFAIKSKNKKYGWYGSIRAKNDVKKLTPGQHTFTTSADLKAHKRYPDIAYLCPTITVRNLKSGSIVVESVEVVTNK